MQAVMEMTMTRNETVGRCKIDRQGNGVDLVREYYGQGMIFKDWDAYQNRANAPCYVPELSDTVYSRNDFLRICNGQEDLAEQLFEGCDWQHPESLFEDWEINGEWQTCKVCGQITDTGGGEITKCPKCGAEMEE